MRKAVAWKIGVCANRNYAGPGDKFENPHCHYFTNIVFAPVDLHDDGFSLLKDVFRHDLFF
jgi:hypothetical protein